jgi:hypothetical protein
MPALRQQLGSFRVVGQALIVVAVLVAARAALWALDVTGMSSTVLSAGLITGGVFVMGLVVAGTLSDYRDAERAPTDIAAGLYAILRDCEALNAIWGAPDLTVLRRRLLAIVTTFRADIDAGDSRTCQAAVEELSESFAELTSTDVGDNPVTRLRAEQSGLRKAVLRVYHLQREEFIPSAYAMIVTIIAAILLLVMFTDFGGLPESLVALGFLSFFFFALLRLLDVISTPFKVGSERTDDDVSLFQLSEFVVHVQASEAGETVTHDVEALAEEVEEQLVEVELQEDDPARAAERATSALAEDDAPRT